jgi:hypothetical protein
LIMLTRTVDEASVRARVNSAHMIALNSRFRPKNSYEARGGFSKAEPAIVMMNRKVWRGIYRTARKA